MHAAEKNPPPDQGELACRWYNMRTRPRHDAPPTHPAPLVTSGATHCQARRDGIVTQWATVSRTAVTPPPGAFCHLMGDSFPVAAERPARAVCHPMGDSSSVDAWRRLPRSPACRIPPGKLGRRPLAAVKGITQDQLDLGLGGGRRGLHALTVPHQGRGRNRAGRPARHGNDPGGLGFHFHPHFHPHFHFHSHIPLHFSFLRNDPGLTSCPAAL